MCWNSEPFFLEADHAHSTNVDRTQELPRSAGARFLRSSDPNSPNRLAAACSLTPGTVCRIVLSLQLRVLWRLLRPCQPNLGRSCGAEIERVEKQLERSMRLRTILYAESEQNHVALFHGNVHRRGAIIQAALPQNPPALQGMVARVLDDGPHLAA